MICSKAYGFLWDLKTGLHMLIGEDVTFPATYNVAEEKSTKESVGDFLEKKEDVVQNQEFLTLGIVHPISTIIIFTKRILNVRWKLSEPK